MVPEVGSVIGERYALVSLLDQGGMGAVWMARDIVSDARVALKILSCSVSNRSGLRRFRRETDALARLDDPNIVRIVGHGVDRNLPFIAMELLEGETLRSLLQRRGALPPQKVVDIVNQVASGLTAAHALRIVHRDIKPSNLFLCAAGAVTAVKVIDFGIATGELLSSDTQSVSTGFIGSPAYMSPEQARAEAVDHRADAWSLAVVAFQMLTGQEPFAGANVPETLHRICSGKVPLPSGLARGLPPALDQVFVRAFAPRRRDRFRDIGDFASALETACVGLPDIAAVSSVPVVRGGRTASTVSYRQGDEPSSVGWKRRGVRFASACILLGMTAALLNRVWAGRAPSRPLPASRPALVGIAPLPSEQEAAGAAPDLPASAASAAPPLPRPGIFRHSSRVRTQPAAPTAASSATPPPRSVSSTELDAIFGLPLGRPDPHENTTHPDAAAGDDARLSERSSR